MTDEIYSAIEVNNEINVNINLQNGTINSKNHFFTTLLKMKIILKIQML